MEGSYVVSEEDALEFVHSLQGPGRVPNLTSALNESSLLVDRLRFSGVDRALLHPRRAAQPSAARAREDGFPRGRSAREAMRTSSPSCGTSRPEPRFSLSRIRWKFRPRALDPLGGTRAAGAGAGDRGGAGDGARCHLHQLRERRPAGGRQRCGRRSTTREWMSGTIGIACSPATRSSRASGAISALLAVPRRPVEIVRDPRPPLLPSRVGSGAARRRDRPRIRGVHRAGSRRRSPHDHPFIPEKFRQLHWQTQSGQHGRCGIGRSGPAVVSGASEPDGDTG